MTQPAVHGQLPQEAPQDTPRFQAGVRALPWRKAAVVVAAGIPVGLLWWLLAPSGLNLLSGDPQLRSGANTEGWLPRDLVLAALFLLAGCISGAVASGSKHDAPSGWDVVIAVGAGALGALAAWGTGVVCGIWWGTPDEVPASASIAFSLRSVAVLAVWPATAALAIFLNTVFSTPAPEAEPGA